MGRSLDPAAWARPLEVAHVTSGFRLDRMHPILRRVLPHTGIDYAAAAGTPVRATGDGSVAFAARRGGYGNLVEVQHPNGYSTRYAHLSRIAPGVARGGMVSQGDVIGYVGMTGLATGPHLHYEVRRRGRPVDPATVAGAGPSVDLGLAPAWRTERRQLGRLLAKAPTLLSRRGGSGD
jgi:murein DD-endopeptidase MepM/ murein hydrolase activator NlpD